MTSSTSITYIPWLIFFKKNWSHPKSLLFAFHETLSNWCFIRLIFMLYHDILNKISQKTILTIIKNWSYDACWTHFGGNSVGTYQVWWLGCLIPVLVYLFLFLLVCFVGFDVYTICITTMVQVYYRSGVACYFNLFHYIVPSTFLL